VTPRFSAHGSPYYLPEKIDGNVARKKTVRIIPAFVASSISNINYFFDFRRLRGLSMLKSSW
jgi:hypothetical protein